MKKLYMEKIGRKWLLLISIIAIICFLFVFMLSIFDVPRPHSINNNMTDNFTDRGDYRQIPIHMLFLSPILLVIAIVTLCYYLLSERLEKNLENNIKIISKLINKNSNNNSKNNISKIDGSHPKNIILKFLNSNERKVVEKLIEGNGSILQSEINKTEGMTKLKTHRAIKNLVMRGIIKTESHGKTNRITLSKDIKDVLLK